MKQNRSLALKLKARKREDGSMLLEGYAARFGEPSALISENGEKFYEYFQRGAFKKALENVSEVIFTEEHDVSKPVEGAEIKLMEDEVGLRADISLPNSEHAKSIYEKVESGEKSGMSFIFTASDENIRTMGTRNNYELRQVSEVDALYEVTVTAFPCYPTTTVSARALEQLRAQIIEEYETEKKRAQLEKNKRIAQIEAIETCLKFDN